MFILSGTPYLAMTTEKIYMLIGNTYNSIQLNQVSQVVTSQKLLSQSLVLALSNGEMLKLQGVLSKKNADSLCNFLNSMLQVLGNPDAVKELPMAAMHTEPLGESDCYPVEESFNDIQFWAKRFAERFIQQRSMFSFSVNAHCFGEKNWEDNEKKTLANLCIPNENSLVWYYSASFLGSVKSALAVSKSYIYYKKANYPLSVLPIADIVSVEDDYEHNCIKLIITPQKTVFLDFATMLQEERNVFKNMLEAYVLNIQFYNNMKQIIQ